MLILKGEKVTLKPFMLKYLPACWKWINDREVTRHLGGPFPKTYADELKWFRNMKHKKDELLFAIIDSETDKYIGNIGIHQINKVHRKATCGIVIGDKSYWNKGYGTDAMKTALQYCFKKLKLNKVGLTVFPENKGAQKCYKRCGFKCVGYLKDDIFKLGKFRDSIYMEAFAKPAFAKSTK